MIWDTPVRIHTTAFFHCRNDWVWDGSKQSFRDWDLWLIVDGTGLLEGPHGKLRLQAGDCLILRPWERYDGRIPAGSQPMRVYYVHYDLLRLDGRRILPAEENAPAWHRTVECLSFLTQMLDRVVSAWRRAPRNESQANAWFRCFLGEVEEQRRRAALPPGEAQRRGELEALCADIRRNPGAGWTLRSMARRLHYSPDHFARIFKRSIGQSPGAFVRAARLESARELLRFSSYPVAKIAAMLGYHDAFHFSKDFRLRTGQSPSAFRRVR